MSRLWSAILGVEDLDPTAHFLQLGGHSILASFIIEMIHDEYGVEIPFSFFVSEHATVRGAVTLVEALQATRP